MPLLAEVQPIFCAWAQRMCSECHGRVAHCGTMNVQTSVPENQLTSVQRILERTIEVIETSGEAAIRTNPIAFECGVTPPILYRAYGSREGLIVAAQAERYRRSTAEAMAYVVRYITDATSREELKENIARSLEFIFSDTRASQRRLRAEVIGSSVSRPDLRAHIQIIDREYAQAIADAYQPAVQQGWISSTRDLSGVALWAQGVINARIMVDGEANSPLLHTWDALSKKAILTALFD